MALQGPSGGKGEIATTMFSLGLYVSLFANLNYGCANTQWVDQLLNSGGITLVACVTARSLT